MVNKEKGNGRCIYKTLHIHNVFYLFGTISAIWGANLVGLISTKIGKVVGVHDIIIQSNYLKFRGFRSTGSPNFVFPLSFLLSLQYCCHYCTAWETFVILETRFLHIGYSFALLTVSTNAQKYGQKQSI